MVLEAARAAIYELDLGAGPATRRGSRETPAGLDWGRIELT
jgi:hypothetical protein